MTEQTSRLAIVIDSTGAEKNTQNLATALSGLTEWGQKAAASAGKVTRATEEEKAALEKLKSAIDPVGAAIDTIGRRYSELQKYFKRGLIDKDEFVFLSKKLNETTDELSGVAQAQRDAEKAGRIAMAQQETQAKALESMLAKVDPLTYALKNLDQQQRALVDAMQSGKISSSQYDAYTQKLAETRKEVTGEAQAERDAAKAHDEQRASLQRLVAQLDPVGDAFKRLEQQQKQLNNAKASGILSPEMYDSLSGKLNQMRVELERTQGQFSRTGMSAKQMTNNMRMVPAQMTDIIVSLSSGQAPLTVLLQQGGQLKDMFGGIGPATKALGGYIAGLINPLTLTAAAVGVLGLAYYKGAQEQDEFYKSLTLTGNIAGKTSEQLMSLSRDISNSTGSTVGASAEVLNRVVSSGKIASASLQSVSEAAINMSKVSGASVDQLVSDFEKIADSPTEAIGKLNEQYHFLTLSTYSQIRALEEQGNKEAAAKLATDEYAKVVSERTEDIKQNLGGLEEAWNKVWGAAKGAWDAMADIGRDDPTVKISRARAVLNSPLSSQYAKNKALVDVLKDQLIPLQAFVNSEGKRASDSAIKAQQYVNTLTQQTLSNAQRRTKEQEKLTKAIADGAKISEEEEKRLRKNIDDKYKDPKLPKPKKEKAYHEDAGLRLLDQINQLTASLDEQIASTDKLNSATQQRIKFEKQIADIKTKAQLTADQKSILARSDEILQAYKAQEALSNQVKTLDDYRKMQEQVKTKDEQTNDLLRERLDLLEKAKATGKLQPGEYEKTRSNIYQNTETRMPSTVTSAVGNLAPTGGQLSGTFGGLQQQYGQLDKAQQDLDLWLKQQEDAYVKAGDITAEGEARMNKIRADAAMAEQSIEDQKNTIITTSIQSAMDSVVDIAKTGFGEKSAVYKMAFAADKAYAIAQSIISIQSGIAQAAANPFPMSLVAMAAVAANTASIVSNIKSVSEVGFMNGGYTGNGGVSSVAGVVHGKEYVFDAAATKKIGVSNLESIRKNGLDATLSKPGYGTGAQNISNNSNAVSNVFQFTGSPIAINGNPSDTTIALVRQAQIDGAKQGYNMVVQSLSSGTGKVHNALTGGYATSRKKG